MSKLSRSDLLALEVYHEQRPAIRRQVMAHKVLRQVAIGVHATLYFEDRLTIQYQIQEMLRVEKIFEAQAIQEELDAYNPLIPDGTNWKATFMIEYEDATERQAALEKLVGVEDKVWASIGRSERVWAVADEDLERSRETKTSAVHFLRFPFSAAAIEAAKSGASVALGIAHEAYDCKVDPVERSVADALISDFR